MLLYAIVAAILAVVHSQYPRLELKGSIFVNNSFINRRTIGTGDGALKCVTNNTACCTNLGVRYWTDPADAAVHQGTFGSYFLYVTRGDGVVSFNRRDGGVAGMWRCSIPDSTGMMQNIYIYTGSPLGFTSDGRFISVSLSFTGPHTEPTASSPEFTLTCRSEGGPATTVSWQRNGTRIEEDSDHVATQIIVDRDKTTVYENTLWIRGREGGNYQCTVSNTEYSMSTSFTVQVPGQPTGVSAVQHSDTNIEVSWISPGSPATGYIIYYQPDGGDVRRETISGVDIESYILSNLEYVVNYNISIIAVSDHLPGAVVGPVRLSVLTLDVEVPTAVYDDGLSTFALGIGIVIGTVVTLIMAITVIVLVMIALKCRRHILTHEPSTQPNLAYEVHKPIKKVIPSTTHEECIPPNETPVYESIH